MRNIPTIQELYDGIIADIESEFAADIPEEGKNYLRAFAVVQAAKLKPFYLGLGLLQKNIFIDTADPVSAGGTLERFGVVRLGRYPFSATQGIYTVTVTGQDGSTIPAGTTFKSDDNTLNPGKLFRLDTAHTMAGTTDTIILRALEAGTGSALSVAETLTATQPIDDVDSTATVATVTSAPSAAEDIEVYRRAGIISYRLEPQGGADSDYILWASDAQGVARSYPYAKSGEPWVIELYVEATIADSTDGKGTPDAGLLSDVADVVELDPDTTLPLGDRRRRPMQIVMDIKAIVPLDVIVTVDGLADSTAEKQDLISDAIRELLAGIRPFIAGADAVADRNDKITINKIITAIQNTIPGQEFDSVTMTVDGNAETSYEFDNGEIPAYEPVLFT